MRRSWPAVCPPGVLPAGLGRRSASDPNRARGGTRPDQLRGQVEENLRQLGRDHLDLVNLRQHGLDSVAEHVGALAELRDAGLIRHLGISNVRPHHLAQAQAVAPVVCVQNAYGLGYRARHDEFVRACAAQGVAYVPFFAIATAGREAGAVGEEDPEVRAVAAAHGVSTAQVRLAWTLHRGPNVLAIPGTGNPEHLVANVAAGALRLTPDDLARAGGGPPARAVSRRRRRARPVTGPVRRGRPPSRRRAPAPWAGARRGSRTAGGRSAAPPACGWWPGAAPRRPKSPAR
ncbi:aldo/keto reductase [Micromonospora sp. NPDC048830]|uniref:aldo/keto reductase n=1 Tax=Micromonospora sp. NPDC048830 TaxID=3364257 RepID=UPI00371DBE32